MKLSKRFSLLATILLAVILAMPHGITRCYADDYTFKFQWTANHSWDNVEFYRLYWTLGSFKIDNPPPPEGMLEVDDSVISCMVIRV